MSHYQPVPRSPSLRVCASQLPSASTFGVAVSNPPFPMRLSAHQLFAVQTSDRISVTALDYSTPLDAHSSHASSPFGQQPHLSFNASTDHISSAASNPTSSDPSPPFNPTAMGLSLCDNLSRPLTPREKENLAHLDRLRYFLATATSRWRSPDSSHSPYAGDPVFSAIAEHVNSPHPYMSRFYVSPSEHVTCVLWNGQYYITGTDIVRSLVFRFEAFGRPVRNMKKFEEGVFSDLRNLKPGIDAILEEPKVCATVKLLFSFFMDIATVTVLGPFIQVSMYTHAEETKGILLVRTLSFVRLPSLTLDKGIRYLMTDSSSMLSNVTSPATPRQWWSANLLFRSNGIATSGCLSSLESLAALTGISCWAFHHVYLTTLRSHHPRPLKTPPLLRI